MSVKTNTYFKKLTFIKKYYLPLTYLELNLPTHYKNINLYHARNVKSGAKTVKDTKKTIKQQQNLIDFTKKRNCVLSYNIFMYNNNFFVFFRFLYVCICIVCYIILLLLIQLVYYVCYTFCVFHILYI